ncbi:MAG: FprA family A-type flavoprotein [Candidatus Gastranaerophilales bacterium]|nr:FprA family A-type flavoprotein [Candidatus Gastranaerophilales bacterium]
MKFKQIKENIFYCGLNDADRVIFDELIPLEHGTTYNSYLINGSEKTAIIDTMYPPFTKDYLDNLDDSGVKNVDYIIANHGEQDHSGSIPALLEKYPNAKVVTNNVCKGNIMEMLLVPEDRIIVIKDKETLSLGDKTFEFRIAPGVHWPDTMFTRLVEDSILFTCDFLGAHLPFEELYSKNDDELISCAKRYYAEIMMPFRPMCKKYVKLIDEIKPEIICPSHGPLHDRPEFILDLYRDWASDEPKNLVLIPYVSMYKSVEEMAFYVKEKLESKGIKALCFDIIESDLGDIAMNLVDAATIIIGVSMVLASPHPAAANVAYIANLLKPKAKFASFIGSYGWGGDLFGKLGGMLSNLKVEVIEPVLVKGKPKEEDYKALDVLVDSVVEAHKKANLL